MSHSYSDISRDSPVARVGVGPTPDQARTVDLYDVFCGVLYLLKSGCQWRMLPADFSNWRTCQVFPAMERAWPGSGFHSGAVLKKNRLARPTKQWTERADQLLQLPEPRTRTPLGTRGYDAGKKVSGIKRHIAVDTQGLPHGIHVTTADVTDRAGALAMFD